MNLRLVFAVTLVFQLAFSAWSQPAPLNPNSEVGWGPRPPRAQFSAPSRKTSYVRKNPPPLAFKTNEQIAGRAGVGGYARGGPPPYLGFRVETKSFKDWLQFKLMSKTPVFTKTNPSRVVVQPVDKYYLGN